VVLTEIYGGAERTWLVLNRSIAGVTLKPNKKVKELD